MTFLCRIVHSWEVVGIRIGTYFERCKRCGKRRNARWIT